MAEVKVCDGCGAAGETTELGFSKKFDYCETCAPRAEDVLNLIDELHTKVSKTWDRGKGRICKHSGLKVNPI